MVLGAWHIPSSLSHLPSCLPPVSTLLLHVHELHLLVQSFSLTLSLIRAALAMFSLSAWLPEAGALASLCVCCATCTQPTHHLTFIGTLDSILPTRTPEGWGGAQALRTRRQMLYRWAKSPSPVSIVLCLVECRFVWLLCFERKSFFVAHDGLEVTLFLPPSPEH